MCVSVSVCVCVCVRAQNHSVPRSHVVGALSNMMRVRMRLDAFHDDGPYASLGLTDIDTPAHRHY